MRVAVMQPYIFPYLGYFQLLDAVDRFVVLDDATFIRRGWINRNRILLDGEPHLFTVPLDRASPNRRICDIGLADEPWRAKLRKKLAAAYASAPHRDETLALLERVIDEPAESIGDLARRSLQEIASQLRLETEFVPTARVYANDHLKAQERILDICRQAAARVYVNPPGGRDLYHDDDFASSGVELRFLEPELSEYDQRVSSFQPGLSVLDALMWNGAEGTRALLSGYRVLPAVQASA